MTKIRRKIATPDMVSGSKGVLLRSSSWTFLVLILGLGLVFSQLQAFEQGWEVIGSEQTVPTSGANSSVVFTAPSGTPPIENANALIAAFPDQQECRVSRLSGIGGVIALLDGTLAGPFLAVYWSDNGEITGAYRKASGQPINEIGLGNGSEGDLLMVRRGNTFYAYLKSEKLTEPLIAADMDVTEVPSVGVFALGQFECVHPTTSTILPAQRRIFDLELEQAGTVLTGDWEEEENDEAIGGKALLGAADESVEPSVSISLKGLFPGGYDIWLKYVSGQERANQIEAEVEVSGVAEQVSFGLDNRVGDGLWIGLGRHEVEANAEIEVNLARKSDANGALSLDAIRLEWVEWDDEDHDGFPDAWEEVYGLSNSRLLANADSDSDGISDLMEFLTGSNPTQSDGNSSSSEWIVVYADSEIGSDLFDGHSATIKPGPWHGKRSGPKPTVNAALQAAAAADFIELHLNGMFETSATDLQGASKSHIRVLPGVNGSRILSPTQFQEYKSKD